MKSKLFVLVLAALVSMSVFAEPIAVSKLQKVVKEKTAELEKIQVAIEEAEIVEGKAMVEITDGLKAAGTTMIVMDVVIPVTFLAIISGPQGGRAGFAGAVKGFLPLLLKTTPGRILLGTSLAVGVAIVVIQGRDYITFDREALENLREDARVLEQSLKILTIDLKDLDGDLELETEDL